MASALITDPTQLRRIRRQQRTTRWTNIRAQGRRRFLMHFGLLGLGLPLTAFKAAVDFYLAPQIPASQLVLNLLLLPLCGVLIASVIWSSGERRYLERGHGRARD
ncbi:MAG: hypothetical protein JO317_01630 [Verrucomicrobiae bacterium]|nr:hypothetical protein [Verrucomicrobiae bacterium]